MPVDFVKTDAQFSVRRVGATVFSKKSDGIAAHRATWNGFRWAMLGNLVYAVSQYGMVVVLAQVGSPQDVGRYALALAIAGPIMFFCSLQLRAILASDAGRTYEFCEYWHLRMATAPAAWILVAATVIIGGFGAETSIVIVVVGGAKALETLSDLCHGSSQRNNRLDLVGKSLVVKGPVSLALFGALTWMTGSVPLGMVGVGSAWLAILLFYDLPNALENDAMRAEPRELSASRWQHQRRLIAVGLPLGVSIAALSLTLALPNILVGHYLGEHEVGIYAALTSLAWAGIPLINAFGQTAMPKYGELYVAGDYPRLRTMVALLAALGAGLGAMGILAAWFFGERIVLSLYGQEYAGRGDLLMWLMVSASLLYTSRFVADALTAMRRTRIHLIAQGGAALVVLAGGIAVLPQYGLVGVAKVMAAAFSLRGAMLVGCFSRSR